MFAASNAGVFATLISSVAMLAGCATVSDSPQQVSTAVAASKSYFSNWPEGTDPAIVGRRIANNVAARGFDFQVNASHRWIIYPEVCAWYGALFGLVPYVDAAANIRETVVGTNKASKEVGDDLQVQRKFYFDRPRKTGDLHGQSPMLWTAAALLR